MAPALNPGKCGKDLQLASRWFNYYDYWHGEQKLAECNLHERLGKKVETDALVVSIFCFIQST